VLPFVLWVITFLTGNRSKFLKTLTLSRRHMQMGTDRFIVCLTLLYSVSLWLLFGNVTLFPHGLRSFF